MLLLSLQLFCVLRTLSVKIMAPQQAQCTPLQELVYTVSVREKGRTENSRWNICMLMKDNKYSVRYLKYL